mgnify:CR=1 FL=1
MIMVCANRQSADMLKREYPQFKSRIYGPNREQLQGLDHTTKVVVDNAEWLLSEFLGRVPYAATMTATVYRLDENPFVKSNNLEKW